MNEKKKKLILSSSSKNRELILKKIRVPFEAFVPNVDEKIFDEEKPQQAVKRLSYKKAMEAKKKFENQYILSADTVVYARRKIIEKTKSLEQAKLNLLSLSGRRHRVYTGITFLTNKNICLQYVCKSIVKFKVLDDQDIKMYLSLNEWSGCAGSYSIQGFAESFVEMISGSFSNVVGLPMHHTYKLLKNNNLI